MINSLGSLLHGCDHRSHCCIMKILGFHCWFRQWEPLDPFDAKEWVSTVGTIRSNCCQQWFPTMGVWSHRQPAHKLPVFLAYARVWRTPNGNNNSNTWGSWCNLWGYFASPDDPTSWLGFPLPVWVKVVCKCYCYTWNPHHGVCDL